MGADNFLFFCFLALIVFFVGAIGLFFCRKNLILILICIEIMFVSCTLLLALFSVILQDSVAVSFIFLILASAGADAAIGLAIIVSFFRARGRALIDSTPYLKG